MNLDELREQIDKVDVQLLKLFEERLLLVSQISTYKKVHNLPIDDKARENAIFKKHMPANQYLKAFLEQLIIISKEYQKNA